jgi:putative oxidoreductase
MKKKIIFAVSLLFGLMMINAGLDKFLHYMPMPTNLSEKLVKAFNAFMEIGWLLPLVGLVEIIGGILFIIPKTRALGAIVILPVIVGIMLTNTITDTSGLPIALIFFAINLWVIFENRNKYLQLLN